jgi:alkanesulfonate monooxygenase SsuD/methylene tetrahydromethanopterin reductase-like flavin-dependent oxidoreductase (luciferase family)
VTEQPNVAFGFSLKVFGPRGLSDEDLYREVLDEAHYLQSLGFQSAWALEHHFGEYSPTPDPLLLLASVAARCPDLSLGTAVVVGPWHHPVLLAEQIAELSLLCHRQLYLGIGASTNTKLEWDALGISKDQATARFIEGIRLMREALSGETFTFDGDFYNVPRSVRLRPKPAADRVHLYGQLEGPDTGSSLWELGLLPLCTAGPPVAAIADSLEAWKSAARADDIDTSNATVPLVAQCIVADTDAEAVQFAREFIPRHVQIQVDHYAEDGAYWGERDGDYEAWHRRREAMRQLTMPENVDTWVTRQLVGSPATVGSKVRDLVAAGINHFVLGFGVHDVPYELRREWASRFAEAVVPEFVPTGAPG